MLTWGYANPGLHRPAWILCPKVQLGTLLLLVLPSLELIPLTGMQQQQAGCIPHDAHPLPIGAGYCTVAGPRK